ncbi:MAG: MATE family efflux transporter [Clostridia bacterium]|nr:MATE family efflux transporter [Clostridia bacterium]
MKHSEEQLATGKMLPLILKMALPSIAAQVVNLLYSIVDRIYIGHMDNVGTNALAGIGITGSVIMLIAAFSSFVGGGGAPLASIALGKGDRQRAEKILANGLSLLIFFGITTACITYIFKDSLLRLIGADDVTFGYASDYLSVYLAGTLFVMLSVGLNSFISCQGRADIAMISVVIGAVLNIALDPLFIFTFNMGVSGAALATVISQFCSALFVVCFLTSNKASLQIKFNLMAPDFKIIGSIAALGIAPFIMASTESVIGFALNSQLQRYGGAIYVSALTVMQSTVQLASVPITGFGQGVTPILSYNYGAGNAKRVKQGFKIMLGVIFTFNFVLTLSMVLLPKAYASLFTDDKQLIELVGRVMPLFISGSIIFGLQRSCQNTFIALGQAKISLFIAILRKILLLVPLAYILPIFFGVEGVYIAESVADVIAAVTCFTLFLILFPKIMKKCHKD